VTEPHHEPSYYEIALTNRQVVVAFVILLACLLAAFFSGVWIGRGGIEPRHDQMVRVTPPEQTTPEGHTLEELKFFTDRQNKKGKQENRAEDKSDKSTETVAASAPVPTADDAQESRPKPASTLQQDLEPSSSPPPPSSRSSRSAKSSSVVRQTPPAPVQAEPAEAPVRPEPVQSRAAADRTAETGGGGGAEGSVVIQVFASADPAEAGRVRDRLAKGGQSAFLSPLTVDGRTMYRVRIGPFTSRQKAQTVAEKVRKNYKLDTWLTQ
jgi:cell division septation protein DedD